MFDVLIKRGKVIDGTGNPHRRVDIGITSETIMAVEARLEDDFGRSSIACLTFEVYL
jgi:N-acyl-D-aspartate/D-glutamate deacylase